MRTLPRHTGKTAALGDYAAVCDICGSVWLRSRLREDPYDGYLKCPKEKGADAMECAQLNRELTTHYDLRMDAEGAYNPPDPPTTSYLDDLYEEAFGQPYRDPLEDL